MQKRLLAVCLLLSILLTGCWDNKELDALFIITAVALDKDKNSEEIEFTIQVNEAKRQESGAKASAAEKSVIVLNTKSHTMVGAMIQFNRDSSHRLLLHHNQVLLFGTDLAKEGIDSHLDLFLRDQQARVEVPIAIVDSNAKDILEANLEQDDISGIFLSGMMDDMAQVSEFYRVRVIDYVSSTLKKTMAPLAPIIKLVKKGDKQEVTVEGMAIFKDDKMIDKLDNEETTGYIYAKGNVDHSDLKVDQHPDGKLALRLMNLKTQTDISMREDGGIRVHLTIYAALNVSELKGFTNLNRVEMLPFIREISGKEIERRIRSCFEKVQKLQADIYGYGDLVYKKYPKQWKDMEKNWDDLFSDIELTMDVNTKIQGTGQITQSLEMDEKKANSEKG